MCLCLVDKSSRACLIISIREISRHERAGLNEILFKALNVFPHFSVKVYEFV